MDIQAEKIALVKRILDTEDEELIQALKDLVERHQENKRAEAQN